MKTALQRLRSRQDGVTAVETAFILPVLLFGLMMLFELAHMAMVIAAGNLALEHAVQRFRSTPDYFQLSPEALEAQVVQRMSERSFNLFQADELKVDVLPFENLRSFGESRYGASEETSSGEDAASQEQDTADRVFSPPILSVTVDLKQSYLTTFPALFGLGDGYQYQYRHLLGNLPSGLESEDSQ
ncbi:MAG: TadE/TadG family type IV pilus assembly protein [Candidatus Pseudomonas phytovorans]|uniref:TadE/TadG family type IV pilus assembly protein n=1 Tax=Candidatus Pseudomonas phytovorans TaxID=3121377 RepID=A0AAJ6BAT9_9PSED|nr:TadE/TadG family type IV pilus assembly protein [Pseudomonas sp.]WEK29044.1 MAG: TadE/TadG family type IV pilus assembly protein [Pseudomonas sp.]